MPREPIRNDQIYAAESKAVLPRIFMTPTNEVTLIRKADGLIVTPELISQWAKQFFPHLLPKHGEACVWAALNNPRKGKE